MDSKNIQIPKGQTIVMQYHPTENGTYYVITRDLLDKYYLYTVNNGKLSKPKTADTPLKFKEVYGDD